MPPHDSLGRNLDTWINPQNEDFRKEMNPETRRFETASILDNILNDDEKRIISQVPNPEIRDIIMEIINELGKSICNWENPSSQLFDEICTKVVYKHNKGGSGVYYWYTRQIIKQLPDWKGFVGMFDYDNPSNSNPSLTEFRKKRWWKNQTQPVSKPQIITHSTEKTSNQQINQEISHSTLEPKWETVQTKVEPTKELVEQLPKQPKVKANYEPVSNYWYWDKFPEFVMTENQETEVPLLTHEDISFSCIRCGFETLTKDTKVPTFDLRGSVKKFFEKNGKIENWEYYLNNQLVNYWSKYCFYNKEDDISHIIVFGYERWITWSINIGIKGKVSQQDAIDLLKNLSDKNILKFDVRNWLINNGKQLSGEIIQKEVADFFNNK